MRHFHAHESGAVTRTVFSNEPAAPAAGSAVSIALASLSGPRRRLHVRRVVRSRRLSRRVITPRVSLSLRGAWRLRPLLLHRHGPKWSRNFSTLGEQRASHVFAQFLHFAPRQTACSALRLASKATVPCPGSARPTLTPALPPKRQDTHRAA